MCNAFLVVVDDWHILCSFKRSQIYRSSFKKREHRLYKTIHGNFADGDVFTSCRDCRTRNCAGQRNGLSRNRNDNHCSICLYKDNLSFDQFGKVNVKCIRKTKNITQHILCRRIRVNIFSAKVNACIVRRNGRKHYKNNEYCNRLCRLYHCIISWFEFTAN